MAEKENVCSGGPKLIFACSGAADVGEISDRAARKLTSEGSGQMFCMAGIGGRVEPIMNKTRQASKILAIDGCALDCVSKALVAAGIDSFEQFRVTGLGLEKGKSPLTEEAVEKVAQKSRELLAG